MNGIGWKVALPGTGLAAICYLYLLADSSLFPIDDQAAPRGLNFILSVFGSAIPKARSYSSYFREQNLDAFASQLVRVYGFCVLGFLLATISYLGARAPSLLTPSKPEAAEQISREQRAYIVRVEWVGIGTAILVAYANLIGWGLSQRTSYFAESTSGANVLGNPVVLFPVLFMILVYLFESRIYLQRAADLQLSKSADRGL